MQSARVIRIRPASWRIFVEGEPEAEYVRRVLSGVNIRSTAATPSPGLTDKPVYVFTAQYESGLQVTAEEIEAILGRDPGIELIFEDAARP